MKKYILLATLLSLTGGLGLSQAAMAAVKSPSIVKYHFICPRITGTDIHTLINSSGVVKGYGWEYIMDKRTAAYPFFSYNVGSANVPPNLKLAGYTNSFTHYNPLDAHVSCHYASSFGFDPFHVTYTIHEGKGGMVASSSATQISVHKFIG